MGIAQRLTIKLCNSLVHRVTNVPAALLGGASQSGYLLLETADFFLLETGDKILLG